MSLTLMERIARAPRVPGRFAFLAAAFLVAVAGCAGGPGAPAPEPTQAFPDPVLEEGTISPGRQAQALGLFNRAEQALVREDYAEARALAERIVTAFPTARVSGLALFVQARAALGEGRIDEAVAAAGRFAALLAPGDPRLAAARIVQAEALERGGDGEAALSVLLGLGVDTPVSDLRRAATLARGVAATLDRGALERALAATPEGAPLRTVALARRAVLLAEEGEGEAARRAARAVLAAGATGADSALVAGVLEGRIPGRDAVRTVRIASVLPLSGSPAMADFARLIAEGVEVAAAAALKGTAVVEVEALDDAGDPQRTAELAAQLRRLEVLGAVGFLEERALAAASRARDGGPVLVSPTARTVPVEGDGVFTLAGPDPQGAAELARYAASTGIVRAALIHSQAPESTGEADAIQTALEGEGVPVVGRFAYEVGATFFEPQIMGAQRALREEEILALGLTEEDTLDVEMLEPVALFVPIPPEDVEFLAPQVTHFGLDTLAIPVYGTAGWTDPGTLEVVNPRHTNGVVATAPVDAGEGSAGYARYREAYESHFQRTLVSPIPALGYDAALLLLEGIRRGGSTPASMRAAMERIRDLEGALGVYSVIGGQVVRRTRLVRLDHGVAVPIS